MTAIEKMTKTERAALYARLDPDKTLALKLWGGEKLSRQELALAHRLGYLVGGGDYDAYLAQYYQDGEKRGVLCSRAAAERASPQPLRELAGEEVEVGSACIVGIHACDVDPKRLTAANRAWLLAHGWVEDQWGSGDRFQTPRRRR